jgi:hypothetical protein
MEDKKVEAASSTMTIMPPDKDLSTPLHGDPIMPLDGDPIMPLDEELFESVTEYGGNYNAQPESPHNNNDDNKCDNKCNGRSMIL